MVYNALLVVLMLSLQHYGSGLVGPLLILSKVRV